ncbi:cation diffusion facilitator CzcD-associated flavoprotein CzcO [Actinopolyspora biskrensis]|uniref:Cation diffusion facilitator CzcD-associated flavoprotein CzcO n=1 Tax=Actinopolyspora biskrensis TaxID=1470178 RepID=A0A852YQD0_9ACTN|nr:NAD(P)/FAD-dependent oxidoreductase [Actinopolyspora biskrensis]NYH77464.1 cation diffusion facilitator CzcD-associated flavoprotein CzcO [Actinopolyspora biskrensis]
MNQDRTDTVLPVAIIGAGPSGLAAAAELGRRGVRATILESSAHLAAGWRYQYDHLRLHTTRELSNLPGMPIPRSYGRWVARDDMVRYLEEYAHRNALDIRLNTPVEHVRRNGSGWQLGTPEGPLAASAVVIATGLNRTPHLPDWPGAETFPGSLVHSARYQNPAPYEGHSVLVVGAGNSGAEIAVALARNGAHRVWWSVRTPPNIIPPAADRWQRMGILVDKLPTPAADFLTTTFERVCLPDLTSRGLPRPDEGLYTRARRDELNPVHDRGLVDEIRRDRVRPVTTVAAIDGPQVHLTDRSRIRPDSIIAATGYATDLEKLLGPAPLLSPRGLPTVRGSRTSPQAPDLYFIGFTNHPSGHLRYAGLEARAVAKAVHRRREHGVDTAPARSTTTGRIPPRTPESTFTPPSEESTSR